MTTKIKTKKYEVKVFIEDRVDENGNDYSHMAPSVIISSIYTLQEIMVKLFFPEEYSKMRTHEECVSFLEENFVYDQPKEWGYEVFQTQSHNHDNGTKTEFSQWLGSIKIIYSDLEI